MAAATGGWGGFGCGRCFAGEAAAVLAGLQDHEEVERHADEPHFIVRVVRCRACGQLFVSVFCERVDWAAGEDPQWRALLPVSPAEAEELRRPDAELTLVEAWGRARPHVEMDWPRDGPKRVWWSEGPLRIAPHD